VNDAVHPFEVSIEHVLVKKEDSVSSLVLSRSAHVAIRREVGEKSGYFLFAKLVGVAFSVEEYESPYP
jgi:hypothetical protein